MLDHREAIALPAPQEQCCGPAFGAALERTRFFPRQLVTPDDLTQDQDYFREKLRRHNRMLHGWGVVCGARVRAGKERCTVEIEAGYLLGPYGDEIVIESNITIDLCSQDLDGNTLGPCGAPADPWCSSVRAARPADRPLYIAVRYAEVRSKPVRVPGCGCGCDSDCEYSRIRDSYVVKVLTELPSTYSDPMQPPDVDSAVRCAREGRGRDCPPCPCEPWVILADVTLRSDGSVAAIDCFRHRRYVVSFADYFFMCQPNEPEPPDVPR